MQRLVVSLRLPDRISTGHETANSLELVGIICRRLCSPCRWIDLVPLFGLGTYALSRLYHTGRNLIYVRWGHLLRTLRLKTLLPRLQLYADAIHFKTRRYDNIFGFIDGTFRPIARPTHWQKQFFSGYKRLHGFHFQGIKVELTHALFIL